MNSYPFYPYSRYKIRANPYFPSRFYRPYTSVSSFPSYEEKNFALSSSKSNQKESSKNDSSASYFENQEPIFELLGISFFYDDLLLICLIFFLYTEGIQDYYLFFALILLLLS